MESKLNCPFCKTPMEKIKRDNVTVDRCSDCRGIWLDKGELDKIVVRRKKHYQKERRNWGHPRVGIRPPSEMDDIDYLVAE